MQRIDPSRIHGTFSVGNLSLPRKVSVRCPSCEQHNAIEFPDGWRPSRLHRTQCANCGQPFVFVAINAGEGEPTTIQQGLTWQGELWMHPPARAERTAIDVEEFDDFPPALRARYQEAIDLFNRQYWTASAAAAGTVVEGIGRIKTGTEKMLGALRKDLEAHGFTGLAADVLEVINHARNAASHYDSKATIGEPFATAMLDLAESVILLAYAIPRRVSVLSLLVNGGAVEQMELADITRRAAEMRRVYQHGGMAEMVQWLARKHPQPTSVDDKPDGSPPDESERPA